MLKLNIDYENIKLNLKLAVRKAKLFLEVQVWQKVVRALKGFDYDEFIRICKRNKLLLIVLGIMILILILLIFSKNYTKVSESGNSDNTGINVTVIPTIKSTYDFQKIKSTNSFLYYKLGGKYYVYVLDPEKTDEQTIRNTLGIDDSIDFQIIYPNAMNPYKLIQQNIDTTVTVVPSGGPLY